ncbi:MAG: DUF5916 domain-containing protein [Candidatus Eisenbacteria bacterium]
MLAPASAQARFSQIIGLLLTLMIASATYAAAPQPAPQVSISRATGPIQIDGELADPGWRGIEGVTTWYETRVGENAEPKVANVGYLAYDDKYLYAGFRFDDPQPKLIRAPISDHDNLSGNTDYGGIIVDSRNDGKTALMFLANANGLTYDAVTDDASGEDNSPDMYWEAKGKITETGWNLEIRVPFSSLRYSKEEAPTWGIMLYRNYPRDRHYQFFSVKQPRDVNCFVCNSSKMIGLAGLPHGSHLVVAPYATAQRLDFPRGDLGSPLANGDLESDFGADIKWSPFANTAIDATINPDFSQVEGDAAQIGANERFALFYPEKRSFFLEGIDLFSTPFQAVYTRSITAPLAGLRATGHAGHTAFTALIARDRGDGLVILPGPEGSGAALQDFESDVAVLRMRRDIGASFMSLLATGRAIEGGGHNAVFGPDFQWRPRPTDTVTGQALWSSSRTPNRTDLAGEWDGRSLEDQALLLRWSHNTRTVDLFLQGQDIGPEFRADEGFMPQVGFREVYLESGYTLRPKERFLSRVRLFALGSYDEDTGGGVLGRRAAVGAGMDGKLGSFFRVELNRDDIQSGGQMFSRFRPRFVAQVSPGRVLNSFALDVQLGDEIDFSNARKGSGTSLGASATVRPNDHIELRASTNSRWLNVEDPALGSGRLFLAQVQRLRASYSFNSRSFIRLIGQYVQTSRSVDLYTFPVDEKSAALNFSALFAYKVNWQTVLYAGYGDDQGYASASGQLERSGRQAFAKVSYALQH